MILNNKKGVSLITVLLFMMIATIAATAVYKWLSNEGWASAARLKQSEAYHASEAGLNTARAWLAYNGKETGAIVTQFFSMSGNSRQIRLDSVLKSFDSRMGQRYSVTLTDIERSGSGPMKMKIVSTGFGRHGSSYTQAAILDVEGLYQVKIPKKGGSIAYKYAYFGGDLKYNGQHDLTSMLINGNFNINGGGPDYKIKEDFIVTGDVNITGGHFRNDSNSCIGGNLKAEAGVHLKNVYVYGQSDVAGSISGKSYFEGNYTQASIGDDNVVFGDNATFNGRFNDCENKTITFNKDLCFTQNGSAYLRRGSRDFRVLGNTWIPDISKFEGYSKAQDMRRTVLGANNQKSWIHIGGNLTKCEQTADGGWALWGNKCKIKGAEYDIGENRRGYYLDDGTNNPNIAFVTNTDYTRRELSVSPITPSCDDEIKDYCLNILGSPQKGCSRESNFRIPDVLTTGYNKFKEKANKGCISGIGSWNLDKWQSGNAVKALNQCYTDLTSANDKETLYNGFLVVHANSSMFANPQGTLSGKFILYFDENPGTIKLPKTDANTIVFLYFAEGADKIADLAREQMNYFIFTKGDIGGFSGNALLNGSVYATEEDCAKVGEIPNDIELKFDENIMNALIDAGVICSYGTVCKSKEESGSSGGSSGESSAEKTSDEQWIPYGPQLKVSLATKYANVEDVDDSPVDVEKSLVVMPRVLYLTTKDVIQNNYNVVYLGGLEPVNANVHNGSVACYAGDKLNSGSSFGETSTLTTIGNYSCEYTETVNGSDYKSPFWLWVSDANSSATVSFSTLSNSIEMSQCVSGNKSKDVILNVEGSGSGTLKFSVYNGASGVILEPQGAYLSNAATSNGNTVYTLNVPAGVSNFSPFKLTLENCGGASGYVQFQLLDEDFSDKVNVGSPSNQLFLFGSSDATVIHKELWDDGEHQADNYYPCNVDVCSDAVTENCIKWKVTNGSCKESTNAPLGYDIFNHFSGPWACPRGSSTGMAVTAVGNVNFDHCEIVTPSEDTWLINNEVVYTYASLVKKKVSFDIEIDGLKGTASSYGHEDDVVDITTDDGTLLGTCETGQKGQCHFEGFYGNKYHVIAKGRNFYRWSAECGPADNRRANGNCNDVNGFGSKRLNIVLKENMTLMANFNKAGNCFNETFTNLYAYCKRELTDGQLGGGNGSGKEDYGYGNDDGVNKYCIDQCVVGVVDGKDYRGKQRVPIGSKNFDNRNDVPLYDIYCSADSTVDYGENAFSYYDESLGEYITKGGYFKYNDPYAVWLKVVMRNAKATPKGMVPYTLTDNVWEYNNKKEFKNAFWNSKPHIDRTQGSMSPGKGEIGDIILRKMPGGYNGTFTRTFSTSNDTVELKNMDGADGVRPALIFRSTPDLSSYYQLYFVPAAGNGSGNNSSKHLALCYCEDYQCFYRTKEEVESSSDGYKTQMVKWMTPKNSGRCIQENSLEGLAFTSEFLKDKTIEMTADLEEDDLTVILSISDNNGSGQYYTASFNMFDEKFGIDKSTFNEETHQHVGFTTPMGWYPEVLYNLNWRSGGSCQGSTSFAPALYCGFENNEVEYGKAVEPTRYVYDYCPEGETCKCTYEYKFNYEDNSKWRSSITFNSIRDYKLGELEVRANCTGTGGVAPLTLKTYCKAFSVKPDDSNPGAGTESSCTRNYDIFMDAAVTDITKPQDLYFQFPFTSVDWGIQHDGVILNRYQPNNWTKADQIGAGSAVAEGEGCNDYLSANGTDLNPSLLNLYVKGTNKLDGYRDGSNPVEDTKEYHLNLKDPYLGQNFLNMQGAKLSFRLIDANRQGYESQGFYYWLEDVNGGRSEVWYQSLCNCANKMNATTGVCSDNNLCKSKASLDLYRPANRCKTLNDKNAGWLTLETPKLQSSGSFNASRVSKIYFKPISNAGGAQFYLANIQSKCESSMSLSDCKINGNNFSDEVLEVCEGEPLTFSANGSGLASCGLSGAGFISSEHPYSCINSNISFQATPLYGGPITITATSATNELIETTCGKYQEIRLKPAEFSCSEDNGNSFEYSGNALPSIKFTANDCYAGRKYGIYDENGKSVLEGYVSAGENNIEFTPTTSGTYYLRIGTTTAVYNTDEVKCMRSVTVKSNDASACNEGNSDNLGYIENRNDAPSITTTIQSNKCYKVYLPHKGYPNNFLVERLSGEYPTLSIKSCNGTIISRGIFSGQGSWNSIDVSIPYSGCNVYFISDKSAEMRFNSW